MPADNQVVLEGIAKFEALQRQVQGLVATIERDLGTLAKDHPLRVDVAKAQISLNGVLGTLQRTLLYVNAPRILNIRTEQAEQRIAALSAQVKQASLALTDFGPADPLGKFRQAVNTANAAVSDFVARTTQGSSKFGRGFEEAAARSKIALDTLQREIKETASSGSPIPAAAVAQVDRLETEYRQATTAAHQFRVAQARVREGIRSTAPPINELNASLSRVASTVRAFVVAAAINELRELGTSSFTVSQQLKAIDLNLTAALGSSDKAAEAFAFVRAESDRLGFGLLGAVDAYARLATAARGTALEGEGIAKVFTQFAERATVAQLSSEDFAGVIRALEQIISKGTLSMEELRQQLGDRLPGTLRLAGKALGFTEGEFKELFDLVRSNSVSSIEFIQLFGNVVQREIAEQVPEASKLATAEINRMKNELLLAKSAAGDELAPAVAELAKSLRELVSESGPTIELLGKISGLLISIVNVGVRVNRVFNSFVGFGAVFDNLSLVISRSVERVLEVLELVNRGLGFDQMADNYSRLIDRVNEKTRELERETGERTRQGVDHFRRLFGAVDEAEETFDGAKGAAEDFGAGIDFAARKMDGAINDIIQYADEVEKSGNIQRAEADKIVKAVDKQLKAIRELPGAEGAAFALREQQLVALRDKFFEFTTEYEKQQGRQQKAADRTAKVEASALNQRTDRYRNFLLDIKRLTDEALEQKTGGEDLVRQRAAAEEELRGLEEKPQQEVEDVARIEELHEQIRSLNRDIQRAGTSAQEAGVLASLGAKQVGESSAAAMKEFSDGLLRAVGTSEEFRSVFNATGEAGRAQLESLVRGLVASAEAGKLATSEVQNFAQAFSRLAEESGLAAGGFTSQVQLLFGQTDTVTAAFDTLRSSAEPLSTAFRGTAAEGEAATAVLRDLGAAAPPAAASVGGLTTAVEKAVESFISIVPHGQAAAASAADVGQTYATLTGQLDEAATSNAQLGQTYSLLAGQLDGVTEATGPALAGIAQIGDKTIALQKGGQEAGGTLTTFGGKVYELKGQGEQAAEGLGSAAEGASELAQESSRAASGLQEAGTAAADAKTSLGDLGANAEEGVQGLRGLGDAAAESTTPLGDLAERAKAVTSYDLPKFFGDAADQVDRAAKGTVNLATGVGKIEKAVTEAEGGLTTLRDKGEELAESWTKADTAVTGFNERAGIAIGLCKELTECLAGLAAS